MLATYQYYLNLYYFSDLQRSLDEDVKDLQQELAEYCNDISYDDMFTWHEEGHRVKLPYIYVPVEWVKYDETGACVNRTELEGYLDILKEVQVGHCSKHYLLYYCNIDKKDALVGV